MKVIRIFVYAILGSLLLAVAFSSRSQVGPSFDNPVSAPGFSSVGTGAGYLTWHANTSVPAGKQGYVQCGANAAAQFYCALDGGPPLLAAFFAGDLGGPNGSGQPQAIGFHLSTEGQLGNQALTLTLPNDTTVGATVASLAKATPEGAAVIADVTDTGGVVGIVTDVSGTKTSTKGMIGNVRIAVAGQARCLTDGPVTAGDYVQISPAVAGACHDAGASWPASGQVIGRFVQTQATAGTYPVLVFGPENQAATPAARTQRRTPKSAITLDQIQDPAADKQFNMGGFALAFSQSASPASPAVVFRGFDGAAQSAQDNQPWGQSQVLIRGGGSNDGQVPLEVRGTNPAVGAMLISNATDASIPALVINNPGAPSGDLFSVQKDGADQLRVVSNGNVRLTGSLNIQSGVLTLSAASNQINLASSSASLKITGYDATSNLNGSVIIRAGSITGGSNDNVRAEPLVLQAGDNASTGTGNAAADLTARGGNCTGASGSCNAGNVIIAAGASANGQQGITQIIQAFALAGTIAAANDAVCATGDGAVADCPAKSKSIYFAGSAVTTAAPVQVVAAGFTLMPCDNDARVGDIVTLSNTAPGKVHDNRKTQSSSFEVGYVASIATNGASSSLPLVYLVRE